eukprot:CAMPEP_0167755696 /NCGR_PEP_ID=MMETSP0110_2-20121227/8971_1 /TAXON_ID=629695 /ORGANISM="Gymnochlora sp., Strain CCMP2014" /LENGTH=355 /DNA_ID=CAMNT_0007641719 /DNA_START=146 /DNA_END=1210 /DNA_ORIENTATION=+
MKENEALPPRPETPPPEAPAVYDLVEDSDRENKALNAATKEMESLEAELEKLKEENKNLSGQAALAVKRHSQILELNEKIIELERRQSEAPEDILKMTSEIENISTKYSKATKKIESLEKEKKAMNEKYQALFFAAKRRKQHTDRLAKNVHILKDLLLKAQAESKEARKEHKKDIEMLKRSNKAMEELVLRKSKSLLHAMQALDNTRINFKSKDGKRIAMPDILSMQQNQKIEIKLREEISKLRQELRDCKASHKAELEDQRKNFLKLYNIGSYDEIDPQTMSPKQKMSPKKSKKKKSRLSRASSRNSASSRKSVSPKGGVVSPKRSTAMTATPTRPSPKTVVQEKPAAEAGDDF